MRKFIASPVAGGAALTLGDDSAGNVISGGEPMAKSQVQTVLYFRAPNSTRIDRGNVTNAMQWNVSYLLAEESTAQDFYRDHPQAVANLDICTLQDIGTTTTRYFANAKITARAIRYDGRSVQMEYSMEAGAESTNAP